MRKGNYKNEKVETVGDVVYIETFIGQIPVTKEALENFMAKCQRLKKDPQAWASEIFNDLFESA